MYPALISPNLVYLSVYHGVYWRITEYLDVSPCNSVYIGVTWCISVYFVCKI